MYVVNAQRTIQFFRWITHLSYLKSKRFKIEREKKFFFFFETIFEKAPAFVKKFSQLLDFPPFKLVPIILIRSD